MHKFIKKKKKKYFALKIRGLEFLKFLILNFMKLSLFSIYLQYLMIKRIYKYQFKKKIIIIIKK